MDHFTKWEEAFPIRDHKAHTVAKVLLDRLFSRFGMPEELLSDQGPEFEIGREMVQGVGRLQDQDKPLQADHQRHAGAVPPDTESDDRQGSQ